MALDPQLLPLLVLTTAVGLAMTIAGVRKNALEWRRRQRVCPSCGRLADICACE
jgi:hypothetical protein